MFKELFDKTIKLAGHKNSKKILGFISFVESFVFPIPPDVLIIPMTIADRQKWLRIANITKGPVFRRFQKESNISINRLTDQTVALIIKKYLNIAGIESENYSGHSLRSGFATSAAEAGVEERNIMAMTGHKSSEMVRRYIKEANLFKNNALNNIKI